MGTKRILSKLNIKDYNNELEKILENKLFSEEAKNLLLSMLYKIETSYNDYKKVKVEVISKKDLLNALLNIIRDRCHSIEFIKLNSEEEVSVDVQKGEIVCYPNEKSLLSSILYLCDNDVKTLSKYRYAKESITEMMKIGSNVNQVEIIRDFNGWSWDSVVKEIENLRYNIIYQSLLLLNGKKLVYVNLGDHEVKENLILNKKSKECEKFVDLVHRLAMATYLDENEEKLSEVIELKKETKEKLDSLKNKRQFVQVTTDKKKKCTMQIENIDKIINNTDLLKKEYRDRNEKLPNKEKIFSISHLADKLEDERKELLDEIQQCNRILDPKRFVKEKENIEKEYVFLQSVTANKDDVNKQVIDLCIEFLRCAEKKISKLEDKNDIVDWIYKIRYYKYIPFDEILYLKDIEVLQKYFKQTIKVLINKAQKYKVWEVFSEDQELTYMIINELLNTKIISFENINILCKYQKEILTVEYYDGNALEFVTKFELKAVKIKKKIKLFI